MTSAGIWDVFGRTTTAAAATMPDHAAALRALDRRTLRLPGSLPRPELAAGSATPTPTA
jgi:hypothetical protein